MQQCSYKTFFYPPETGCLFSFTRHLLLQFPHKQKLIIKEDLRRDINYILKYNFGWIPKTCILFMVIVFKKN